MVDGGSPDDPTIPDDAELWRRVPPWHFYFDEKLGRTRPSKAAFEDDGDGSPMSVVLAAEAGRPEEVSGSEVGQLGFRVLSWGFEEVGIVQERQR